MAVRDEVQGAGPYGGCGSDVEFTGQGDHGQGAVGVRDVDVECVGHGRRISCPTEASAGAVGAAAL
ncbi:MULTISPECIES: hypothetical protein [Streptomyces]|uniref:hypothetical protein n=1 Tax=Streptomyces TaxID=1883 RepID=UPI0029A956D5|nr:MULTISPECIES: hypothetical protein [unclassified Streptomyces]MDX2916948.1 hypothetical protein [Streptomyces sp. NE06-03C]MDX3607019.1 hypothetical protein [Streptomyces sp. FL06-04B]MDX3735547.1 hypothetical protein [Streptomyces sp. ID01-15D]